MPYQSIKGTKFGLGMFLNNFAPIIFAILILVFQYMPLLKNPAFPGDSGIRLEYARYLILHAPNHIWLPILQAHIHLLYILKSPVFLYKLIPISYLILLLFMLNLLSVRILGPGKLARILTTFVLLSLVNNRQILFLGNNLYQEIPTFTIFYLLYYSYFTKNLKLFYTISCIAMLTREYFWVYYLVFVIAAFRKRKSLSISPIFLVYVFIPIIWLFTTKQAIWGSVKSLNLPFNLLTIYERSGRLLSVFLKESVFPIILWISLCCVWLKTRKHFMANDLWDYSIFSLISIFGIYLYFIIKDPWQPIPLNPRMIIPLIIHIPLWIILCYKYILRFPKVQKVLLTIFLIFSLLPLYNHLPSIKAYGRGNYDYYRDISLAISNYKKTSVNKEIKIGIAGIEYWTYITYLVGPLLYQNREYVSNNISTDYDILISSPGNQDLRYKKYSTVRITDDFSIQVLYKNRDG